MEGKGQTIRQRQWRGRGREEYEEQEKKIRSGDKKEEWRRRKTSSRINE